MMCTCPALCLITPIGLEPTSTDTAFTLIVLRMSYLCSMAHGDGMVMLIKLVFSVQAQLWKTQRCRKRWRLRGHLEGGQGG
jgi:hypothetical protein